MSRWNQVRCLLGLHHWIHADTCTVGGYEYVGTGGIRHIVGKRAIHHRECVHCDKWQQYYPRPHVEPAATSRVVGTNNLPALPHKDET